jgi:sugar phosphate isomerase/epimerase
MTATHPPIQCSTGPFWAFELGRAMETLAEAGFTEIELMVTRDPVTQKPDIPALLAEEHGLKIAALHAPFLVITKNVWGMDPVGKIKRGAEMCRALGCTSMIVHPPYLWERGYADWVIKESEGFADETGVTVVVETMYPKWVAGRKLRAYRWLEPQTLLDAAPDVALDTSHLAVCREDILKAYDVLRPKLRHIHLSDNLADGRDGHLELEQGVLPIERFLAELRRTTYQGAISLELSVRRYLERHEDLVRMLRRSKEYVEKHLAGSAKVNKGLPRP